MMSGSERALLAEALLATTVALTCGDRVGSGFFVAPGLVLTCAHVVTGGGRLPATVTASCGGDELTLTVVPEDVRLGEDLALLRLDDAEAPAVAPLCAVVEPGDDLWAYGYPGTTYRAGDSAAFEAVGPSVRAEDTRLLRVRQRAKVGPGFSGAPVMTWRTGAVCGVLRLADRTDAASELAGARLIPASVILAAYPQLRDQPPPGTMRWLELLDDSQLRAAGWRYPAQALREYLTAVVAAARQHPYAVRLPSMPSLTAVYLRQQAASVKVAAEAAADDAMAPDHLAAGRLEVTQVLEWSDHALILGGPGAGKSSALRILAHEIGTCWLRGEPAKVVPVYIHASRLATGSLSEGLAAGTSEQLASWLDRTLSPDLFTRAPVADTPWLIMIDGIDEVLDPQARSRIYDLVAHHLSDPRYRFLLASRPLSDSEIGTALGKSPVYELQPFSEDQLPKFATNWFSALQTPDPDGLALRFTAQVRRGRLRDLVRTPLLATMLCVLFASRPEEDLPIARATLYRDFLALLLDKGPEELGSFQQVRNRAARYGETAAQAAESLLAGLREMLKQLADLRMNGATEPVVDLVVELTDHLRPPHLPLEKWISILRDVLRHTGVLVEQGQDFEFVHRTLLEYLAACGKVSVAGIDEVATLVINRLTRTWPTSIKHSDLSALRARLEFEEQPLIESSFLLFLAGELSAAGNDMNPLVREVLGTAGLKGVWFAAEVLLDGIEINDETRRRVCEAVANTCLFKETSIHWYTAVDAAAQLAELDRERGVRALRGIVNGTFWRLGHRIRAADRLAVYDRVAGVRALNEIASQRAFFPSERIEAAKVLDKWDFAAGLGALRGLVIDTTVPGHLRMRVVGYLWERDSSMALELTRRLATEPGMDGFDRIEIATRAAHTDAIASRDILVEIVADPELGPVVQTTAIEALAELPPKLVSEALAAIVEDRTKGHTLRLFAAKMLAEVDRRAGGDALLALAGDRAVYVPTRIDAAFRAGTADPAAASAVLRGFLTETSVRPLIRLSAVERLARLDPDAGLPILESLAKDPESAGFVCVDAARLISLWDPDLSRSLLLNLTTDLRLDYEGRGRAEAELRKLLAEPHPA
jgi:hypothetical protein